MPRKRRVIPTRLERLVTFERKRELRPRELAQNAVNIARRYPEYHDQEVDFSCANNACLVGWTVALMTHEMPARLSRLSMNTRIKMLLGRPGREVGVFGDCEAVAQRLGLHPEALMNRVYGETNSERAIAAFCELTGAEDPGKLNARAA